MRDTDLMIKILGDMVAEVDGGIIVRPATHGESAESRKERHHILLLENAGLIQWTSGSRYEVTNAGYSFHASVTNESTGEEVKTHFMDRLKAGFDIAKAVESAISTGMKLAEKLPI